MTGQVWTNNAEGGYLYTDELSDVLRSQVRPLAKMRQLCDAMDGSQKGLHRGQTFQWNVYSRINNFGYRLAEDQNIPESSFTLRQASLTVTEYGNSIPYTGKLLAMGKQDVRAIIDKVLRDDAAHCFDVEAYLAFDQTVLTVAPSSGTSTSLLTLETTGTCTVTNNVAMGKDHLKTLSDTMKERNIPPYTDDGCYFGIGHPTTFTTVKSDLETIHQYSETGLGLIMSGEIGKYWDFRLIEQNSIPKGGAADSTTFDPITNTGDAWNNGKSSWAFFMGKDTVTEAMVIPEELRAKVGDDYGRSKGIAWYGLGGFGLVHGDPTNARVLKWDSAA